MRCEHRKLSKMERATKPFLKLHSAAYVALEKVVKDKYLLNDLKYLTMFSHTGTLEVYHSLYNKYCLKRLHFSYEGMIARSQLAVLDFNSGVGLCQAQTEGGDLRYKQQFSKVTQSWVVKKMASKKDKLFLTHLMCEVEHLRTNIALTEKPDKKESIGVMRTRFVVK